MVGEGQKLDPVLEVGFWSGAETQPAGGLELQSRSG